MSEERLKEIKEELAKISFSNIGHCVNTNLILDYITNLQEEIERLNNIIKEAIEYIEERYNGEVLTHTFDKDNVGELLEILKGSDKEWNI